MNTLVTASFTACLHYDDVVERLKLYNRLSVLAKQYPGKYRMVGNKKSGLEYSCCPIVERFGFCAVQGDFNLELIQNLGIVSHSLWVGLGP